MCASPYALRRLMFAFWWRQCDFIFKNSNLQGAHCEERLRIEIVNLREQLDTRTEESGLWIILLPVESAVLPFLYLKFFFHSPSASFYLKLMSSEVLEGEWPAYSFRLVGICICILLYVFFLMCSAVFQSEDRDREDPRSEGAVAGWAAGVPHWTGSPPGGALSCAKHQQDPQQWESNCSLLLDL